MLQRLAAVCLCIYSPSLDQSFTAAASPSRCFVVVTKNRAAEMAGARPRTQCPELHRSMLLLLLSRLMGQPSPLHIHCPHWESTFPECSWECMLSLKNPFRKASAIPFAFCTSIKTFALLNCVPRVKHWTCRWQRGGRGHVTCDMWPLQQHYLAALRHTQGSSDVGKSDYI